MGISLKKAFSIIAFSSVMLTLSICIGFSMFHQYKYEHCLSVKEAWDKHHYGKSYGKGGGSEKVTNAFECIEMVN
jgi:hypothetical protein